jgi:hypothetical protein
VDIGFYAYVLKVVATKEQQEVLKVLAMTQD